MARADATGNAFQSRGKWYARIPIGKGKRPAYAMPWASDDDDKEANARAAMMAKIAVLLRATKNDNAIALIPTLLQRAAVATDPKVLADIAGTVERLAGGKTVLPRPGAGRTESFEDVANAWTSGDLAKRYPDNVKEKRSVDDDKQRLRDHVIPIVGRVPMRSFSQDHAEQVMGALSPELGVSTRRQIAQVLNRVVKLAVYPLRLLPTSPLPSGWMPRIPKERKKQEMPYPVEVDTFVSSDVPPLYVRLFVGFCAREGMRHEEAESLTFGDVDIEAGLISTEQNKTDDSKPWALDPSVQRALRHWRELRGKVKPTDLVFVDEKGEKLNLRPEDYRAWLLAVGVTREKLHKGSAKRKPTAFHALRSLYVTNAFMCGKSERHVMKRTRHTTSAMLSQYETLATTFAEANLAPLGELDVLLGWAAKERAAEPSERDPHPARRGATTRNRPAIKRLRSSKTRRAFSKSATRNGVSVRPRPSVPAAKQGETSSHPDGEPSEALPDTVPANSVEAALGAALSAAAAKGDLEAVKAIVKELEARRLEGSNVVVIGAKRVDRG